MRRLLLFLLLALSICVAHSLTNPQDAAVLRSLKDQWGGTPRSWGRSDDPCAAWEGVACNNSRVTSLGLSTMGLTGTMSGDIGGLTDLISLDLSFNPGLRGSISPRLGDLQKLTILYDLMKSSQLPFMFVSVLRLSCSDECGAGFWPDAASPTPFQVN